MGLRFRGGSIIDAAVEVTLFVENLAEHDGNLRSANREHFRRKVARIRRACDEAGLRQKQAIHAWQKCRYRQWLRSEIDDVGYHANRVRNLPYTDAER